MNHLAILNPKLHMLAKIEKGQKTIESRWYKRKFKPWGYIKCGESVYFKEAGKDVTLKATVIQVKQLKNLTPKIIKQMLKLYRKELGIDKSEVEIFYNIFKNKRYCILIYLNNPKTIKPFKINKAGKSFMSAWICFKSLKDIRL